MDPYIAKWAEAMPEEIVAQAVEYQPIERSSEGIALLISQLPALALHIDTATMKRRGGRWGRIASCSLWYLFKSQQAEGMEIHGFEKNERWKSLIAWRLAYWLKKQKLPATTETEVFDLQESSKIRTLEVDSMEWLDIGTLQGLKFSLTLEHAFAPYEEIDPATFDLLDLSIHTFDEDTPLVAQLEVEAEIDQTD